MLCFVQAKILFNHVEVQKCGSPHIHGLLWVEDTSKYGSTKMTTCQHIMTRKFHVIVMYMKTKKKTTACVFTKT